MTPRVCEEGIISVEEFAAADSLTYTELNNTGLYYYIRDSGSVERPVLADSVEANYTGFITNGRIFDQTTTATGTRTFPLSGVIQGWQLGVPLVGRGGQIRLLIPSELAYGSRGNCNQLGQCSICPDSDLVFDIEVVDFRR
ncbi:MAG: FKBP-type peptidyl-prolyl cis-trans isomerase [Lewinella sp.]